MATVKTNTDIRQHEVVSRDQWIEARKALLKDEKEFTRLRDRLSQQRRQLPWVKVQEKYLFEGPKGTESLSELFDGKSQLIVYHFMFGPDWKEGCSHCSFWADNFAGIIEHLNHRDTTMIAISRTSLDNIETFKKRMGWNFKWVSSLNNDFNFDFLTSARPEEIKSQRVFYNYDYIKPFSSEMPGISTFYKNEDGEVFHTYSTYARGLDMLNTAYHYLDLTAKGRDEDSNSGNPSGWVRHRDKYQD